MSKMRKRMALHAAVLAGGEDGVADESAGYQGDAQDSGDEDGDVVGEEVLEHQREDRRNLKSGICSIRHKRC